MNEWGVFITVGAMISTFLAVYYFLQKRDEKNVKMAMESMEATRKNTEQLIEFNANLKHMNERDTARDNRLNSHSSKLDNHEKRLYKLEFSKVYTEEQGL